MEFGNEPLCARNFETGYNKVSRFSEPPSCTLQGAPLGSAASTSTLKSSEMRALLLVLDQLGVGLAPDTNCPPPPDTLGHLLDEVPDLELPTLFSLGLGEIMKGRVFDPPARDCTASYGRMIQRSAGTDPLSGLWELAGVVLGCPFTAGTQLPNEFIATLARECGVEFLVHRSNNAPQLQATARLEELHKEHLQTGCPILTLAADSTLLITAHESKIPAARLTQICRIARIQCDNWRISRVTGQLMAGKPGAWKQTGSAFNFFMVPPRTLLNALSEKGFPVEAVGAVNDAFARSGVTNTYPTASRTETLRVIEKLWRSPQNGMIFANLGHFVSHSGCGVGHATALECARALREFDHWLGRFLEEIESDNLLIITGANRGDPTSFDPASPRQEVPVLVRYGGRTAPLGVRETFADVAATLGAFFGIDEDGRPWTIGESLITFHRPRGFDGP